MCIKKYLKNLLLITTFLASYPINAEVDSSKHTMKNKSQEIENYVLFLSKQPLDNQNYQGENANLISYLTSLFTVSEVRPDLVRKFESSYINNSGSFNKTLNKGTPYLSFIVQEVKKRNMPGEIALLPFIESSFTTKAQSYKGAKGLWQFMPKTGKQYGLDQTSLYDGRDDFYAATKAALDYLQYLHGLFNDWPLAIAAYNAGENRVANAIKIAEAKGLEPTFDNLVLPKETTQYVPKLLAVRNILQNHKNYSLSLTPVSNKPYFETVNITHPISLSLVAKLAEVPEYKIQLLNPGYKTSVYIPNGKRSLLIPKDSNRRFYDNYTQMFKNQNTNWYALRLNKTQTVSELASSLNISEQEFKLFNSINSDTLLAGTTLFFKSNKSSSELSYAPESYSVSSLRDFEEPLSLKQSKVVKAVYKPVIVEKPNLVKTEVIEKEIQNNSGILKVSNRNVDDKVKPVKLNDSLKDGKIIKMNNVHSSF